MSASLLKNKLPWINITLKANSMQNVVSLGQDWASTPKFNIAADGHRLQDNVPIS